MHVHVSVHRMPIEIMSEPITLPNGSMKVFVMTVITDEELQFGMHNRFSSIPSHYPLPHFFWVK